MRPPAAAGGRYTSMPIGLDAKLAYFGNTSTL